MDKYKYIKPGVEFDYLGVQIIIISTTPDIVEAHYNENGTISDVSWPKSQFKMLNEYIRMNKNPYAWQWFVPGFGERDE